MKYLHLSIIVALIAGILTTSCDLPIFKQTPYKSFLWEKKSPHFTFEYPSDYRVDEANYSEIYQTGSVSLIGPHDTRIHVQYFVPDENEKDNFFRDAKSRVDYLLERIERFGDTDLLEQSNVTISGIPGILLVTREIDYVRGIAGIEKHITFTARPMDICREVDFDYNDQIWFITIDSIEVFAENDKPDFDHLIETFQILGQ